MNISLRQHAARGFTLIELLIVVIIIAILAAIAIPQFSNSSGDAQEAALDANLATMRSAIELYRVQHANVYPGAAASTGGTCTAGTAGASLISTEGAVKDQLTSYSNAQGQTCSVAATGFIYGPYLRAIPAEPINNATTINVLTTAMTDPAVGGTGWRFSTLSGAFAMNSLTMDRGGVKTYFKH
ncbi:MAG: prepilin-type N-terminal cleavage/methylation domain-containing protein [Pseudomonadota bacterium]|nr:prepilin-type N-terminal cleavage/methylation domain-containing protein [Pseudomonadota bacterium]